MLEPPLKVVTPFVSDAYLRLIINPHPRIYNAIHSISIAVSENTRRSDVVTAGLLNATCPIFPVDEHSYVLFHLE